MMNKRMIHLTLAALVIVGMTGCNRHQGPYGKNVAGEMDVTTPTGVSSQPVIVQSQPRPVMVQSQPVIVQSQPGTVAPATAVVVPPGSTVITGSSPTGLRLVEGTVVQQTGNYYVIREDSGREVRLHADGTTRFDRDIRPGDRVVVTVRD